MILKFGGKMLKINTLYNFKLISVIFVKKYRLIIN